MLKTPAMDGSDPLEKSVSLTTKTYPAGGAAVLVCKSMVPVTETRRMNLGSAVISAWERERNTKQSCRRLSCRAPDWWC
jgi:hypothetical protein